MRNLTKRGLSFVIVLALCVSLLSGMVFTANAASYVANWGSRGDIANELSDYATDWYDQYNASYDELAALDGASNLSSVPSSDLYEALASLMTTAHKTMTSYSGTNDLYQYTDCQNGDTSKISLIYRGTVVSSTWDGGSTYNKEHIWPKSLANSDATTGRNADIMTLRPANPSENSSRGNLSYGIGSGSYDPNKASNYNVRGDVARMVLYAYVRYGTDSANANGALNYAFGSGCAFESLDTLIDWMGEDPVDTWEMGRNDAVQSITGTRNVFVDYPELAFQLFNEEVPDNYPTPSGEGGTTAPAYTITAQTNNTAYGTVSLSGSVITATPAEGCYADDYVVTSGTATVTQNGNKFTVNASSDCTVKINFATKMAVEVEFSENNSTYNYLDFYQNEAGILPEPWEDAPEGWEFVGWVTEGFSETETEPTTIYEAGDEFTASDDVTLYALYTRTEGGATEDKTYNVSIQNYAASNNWANGVYYSTLTFTDGLTATAPQKTNTGKYYTSGYQWRFYQSDAGTMTISSTIGTIKNVKITYTNKNTGTLKYNSSNITSNQVVTVNADSILFSIGNTGTATNGQVLVTGLEVTIAATSKTYYATVTCVHEDSGYAEGTPADCENDGYTEGVYCNDCEKYISGHTVIPATGHDYSYVVTLPTATEKGYTTYTCENCDDSYTKNETDALGEVNYGPLSENTPYHLKMVQANTEVNKTLYFTGVMSDEYLATSESEDDAVEVYMEKVEGEGVRFYFMEDGAKKYLEISIKSGDSARPKIVDTPSVVYTYNETLGVFTVLLVAGDTSYQYYLGTYSTFTTIGTSKLSFLTTENKGVSQFCAEFVTFCGHENTTTTTEEPTCTETGLKTVVCDDCGKTVSTEVLEATGHSWDNGKIVPPTAIAQGYTLYTCGVCKETKQENFTESTDVYVTFVTPAGVTLVPAVKLEGNAVTLPTAEAPNGTVEYTFVGWSEVQIDNAADYTGTILAAGSEQNFTEATTLYAAYSYAVETEGEAGEPVNAVFNLGANNTSKSNSESSTSKTTYTESVTIDGITYKLDISGGDKFYPGSFDINGNSIIKLGSSSVAGKFTINNIPANVTSVIFKISGRQTTKVDVTINGKTYTISTSSNTSYTNLEVAPSNGKITFATVKNGDIRAYLDTITFIVPGKATEPVITTYTTTEIGEACEHGATTSTIVEPTTEAAGSLTVTCDDCGATVRYIVLPMIEKPAAPAVFEFSGASLSIENGISVNFKADARLFNEQGYSEPYATFQLMDKTFIVEGVDNGKGQYVFTLYNIQPDWMGEMIIATLTATLDGEQVSADSIGYSVATYCYNKLNDAESSESLKRLMVDVLNYGAASQAYTGHMAEYPVNGDLTEEQKALATAYTAPESVLNISNELTGETAVWQGISLFLRETANIRVRFTSDITEGLSLKGTICGQTYTVDQEDFLQSGNNYYVYFDRIPVYQMRKEITFLVCQNNGGVSETLTYSVASYAAAMMENADVAPLMQAMLTYGDSAAAYVAANG